MSIQLINVLTNIPKDVWRDVLPINRTNMLRLVSKNIKTNIDLIQPFTNIEMTFSNSDFKYRITAEKIIKALKEIIKISFLCSIKKLYLVECDIKRELAFQHLGNVIEKCKYIEELNLSNNAINNYYAIIIIPVNYCIIASNFCKTILFIRRSLSKLASIASLYYGRGIITSKIY